MQSPTLQQVRPAAVAGRFYEGNPTALGAELDEMLAAAPAVPGITRPKALIVPHAGYMYSGPIAASAYKLLLGPGPRPRRVVLLGPAHTVALRGLALPGAAALATPLGTVRVDAEAAARAAALPAVVTSAEAHAREHSLEVQLPFLQRVLGDDFTLVPLVVGHVGAAQVAAVLDELWGDEHTLIIISTDLSHYLPYDVARAIDATTAQQIVDLDERFESEQACGAFAVRGFLQAARKHGLVPRLLDLRNSGDTAGDRRRVVGYAACAFTEADA